MGAGYVSIPYACAQGGWVALGVLWLLGGVFCYTGHVVLQCCKLVDQQQQQEQQEQQQKQQQQRLEGQQGLSKAAGLEGTQAAAVAAAAAALPPAGYEAVAGAAFGSLGRRLVSGVMYAELLGICCVYVVLEAETLAGLLGPTPFGASLLAAAGPSCFVGLASALIAPTVLLPSVGALAGLGALGVAAASAVGLALACLLLATPLPLTELSRTSLLNAATLPQVLGVLAFVYAGHSTFPVIQQSMAQPHRGRPALTRGYAATAAICTLVGAAGYALYGPQTAPVVVSNLPPGGLLALVLTGLTLANPFAAFAVTLEPVALVVQGWVVGRLRAGGATAVAAGGSSSSSKSNVSSGSGGGQTVGEGGGAQAQAQAQAPYPLRASIRLGLALALCGAAAVLPYVADLMGLVGALLTMSVSLILPALMHVCLLGRQLPPWLLVLDGCVLLLGVVCAVVGATSAAGSLQQKLAAAACAAAAAPKVA